MSPVPALAALRFGVELLVAGAAAGRRGHGDHDAIAHAQAAMHAQAVSSYGNRTEIERGASLFARQCPAQTRIRRMRRQASVLADPSSRPPGREESLGWASPERGAMKTRMLLLAFATTLASIV